MDFNEFNPGKALTGAGDMVHGRGIYTTKNKKTARAYKKYAKSKGLPAYLYEVVISLNWRLPLCFDTLRSPDVSGLASDEAALAPVACGGRSDCRAFSSFLILFWTCVIHVYYLYRVWAFFIFWYTCFTGCVGLNIQRGGTSTGCPHWIFRLTGSCRRMYVGFFSSSCRLYSEGTGSMVYYHYDMQMRR